MAAGPPSSLLRLVPLLSAEELDVLADLRERIQSRSGEGQRVQLNHREWGVAARLRELDRRTPPGQFCNAAATEARWRRVLRARSPGAALQRSVSTDAEAITKAKVPRLVTINNVQYVYVEGNKQFSEESPLDVMKALLRLGASGALPACLLTESASACRQ